MKKLFKENEFSSSPMSAAGKSSSRQVHPTAPLSTPHRKHCTAPHHPAPRWRRPPPRRAVPHHTRIALAPRPASPSRLPFTPAQRRPAAPTRPHASPAPPSRPARTNCMERRAGGFSHMQQCDHAPKAFRFDGSLLRDHMRNMRDAAGRC